MLKVKYILVLGALLAFASCKNEHAEKATTGGGEAAGMEKTNADIVQLSKAQIATAGIVWGSAEMRAASGGLALTGEMRVHNEHIATVSALADGMVVELRTGLNKNVAKGEVIAVLRQPQLLDWQQDYLETVNRLSFLEAEFQRYKTLKEENATALKNYQKADADLREAQTHRDLLAAKLRMYQINVGELHSDKVQSEFSVRAPVGGVITRSFVTTGAALQAGSPICEIVDMSQLHADLFVFEKDLSQVRMGQSAQIRLLGQSDHRVTATVFSIDPTVDPERKAVRLHARLQEKPAGALVNGAYVDAILETSGSDSKQLALPTDAVVREGDRHFVFIVKKEFETSVLFQRIPVNVQAAADNYLIIRAETPFSGTEKFVTKGAYYVEAQGAGIEVE